MQDERWRIALTEPNRERLAVDGLLRIGIPSYCPKIIRRYMGVRGSNQVREVAMFPGYLFVKFSLDLPKWPLLFQTPGIRQGCGNGLMRNTTKEAYQELTEAQVSAIMLTERRVMGERNASSKDRGLKVGDEVRIRVGDEMGEMLGTIETLDDDMRIGVLVMLFGKAFRQFVPLERLIAS